jgi:hypothetical protein
MPSNAPVSSQPPPCECPTSHPQRTEYYGQPQERQRSLRTPPITAAILREAGPPGFEPPTVSSSSTAPDSSPSKRGQATSSRRDTTTSAFAETRPVGRAQACVNDNRTRDAAWCRPMTQRAPNALPNADVVLGGGAPDRHGRARPAATESAAIGAYAERHFASDDLTAVEGEPAQDAAERAESASVVAATRAIPGSPVQAAFVALRARGRAGARAREPCRIASGRTIEEASQRHAEGEMGEAAVVCVRIAGWHDIACVCERMSGATGVGGCRGTACPRAVIRAQNSPMLADTGTDDVDSASRSP